MAHVVVANLTDAQFTKLEASGIPYFEIDIAIVPRFVALVPEGMTVEQALNRLIRVAILQGEHQAYENAQGNELRNRVMAERDRLKQELGV